MNSIVRLTGMVSKVHSANPLDCMEEMCQLLEEIPPEHSDIILFPKLALCSPSCGNLFSNSLLTDQCAHALDLLRDKTADYSGYVIAGLAIDDNGRPVSAMAVLHGGNLVALVPTQDDPAPFISGGYSQQLLPQDTVFSCGDLRFCVVGCGLSTLAFRAASAAQSGCDLILIPAYSPVYAGMMDEVLSASKSLSKALGCAIAVVNGGVGSTSSPFVYSGFAAIYECGVELAKQSGGYQGFRISADLDLDVIRAGKKLSHYTAPVFTINPASDKPGLLRPLDPNPFLPGEGREEYLGELFALQVRSLVARMENIGVTKLVLGVSGGLDSTAALLVAAAAMDTLELPRENILGITMPGFGTTDRTYYNALSLLEGLGASKRDISIRQSVQQHFEDIGHSGQKDVTYENAQARERAQILLDIANSVSGLVVGTGDLSEEALGFCTFAGDHISNYNVNVCITKTVLRELVGHISRKELVAGVSETLADILETPVSPELLPPTQSGDIHQKTEDILGPYQLHDFFLYHFIRNHFRPEKLYYYACMTFSDTLTPAYIKEKLAMFFNKFCAAQFKRACAPDSASITEVNLNGVNHYIPSDLDPSFLLRELDRVE